MFSDGNIGIGGESKLLSYLDFFQLVKCWNGKIYLPAVIANYVMFPLTDIVVLLLSVV